MKDFTKNVIVCALSAVILTSSASCLKPSGGGVSLGTYVPGALPQSPSGQLSPGVVYVTWGPLTVDAGGKPGLPLDGGAATYLSDPISVGGYTGVKQGGVFFVCQSAADAGAIEDYITAEISGDGVLFTAAAPPNAALIDGGIADGGTPGWIELGPTAAPFTAIALTNVAPQAAVLTCIANTVPN